MMTTKFNITTIATSWRSKQLQSTRTMYSPFCKQTTMSFLRTEPQISCSSHEQPQSQISMPTMSTTMRNGWLIVLLCSNVNIQLFLICHTRLWPSRQGGCVHVGCSVFCASETRQKCKCMQKSNLGTNTRRSL